jgi:hypothetical protein
MSLGYAIWDMSQDMWLSLAQICHHTLMADILREETVSINSAAMVIERKNGLTTNIISSSRAE